MKSKRYANYLPICKLDLKIEPHQLMTTGPGSGQASSPVETDSRDPSGGKDTGCIATTPEVLALLAAYSTDAHRFC